MYICIHFRLYVRLGEYNITSFPTDIVEIDGGGFEVVTVTVIAIRAMYTHPLYYRDLRLHDIGLIEMEEAANFSGNYSLFIIILILRNKTV